MLFACATKHLKTNQETQNSVTKNLSPQAFWFVQNITEVRDRLSAWSLGSVAFKGHPPSLSDTDYQLQYWLIMIIVKKDPIKRK